MVLYETLTFKNITMTGMKLNEIRWWIKNPPFNIRISNLNRAFITNEIYNKKELFIRIFHFYDIFFKITYIDPDVLKHITKIMIYNGKFTPICEIFVNRDDAFPLHQFLQDTIYIKVIFDHEDNIPNTFEFTYDAGSIINKYKTEEIITYPINYVLNQEMSNSLNICIRNMEINYSNFIYRNSCNYTFMNGKTYRLLNHYDLDVEIQFGDIVIYTNLLDIDIIPCEALFDVVILKSHVSCLHLYLQVIANEEPNNNYCIDGVYIKNINNKWQEFIIQKRKHSIYV